MGHMRQSRRGVRGQAAVEAAVTLPLTIFVLLGSLQLFLMLQARIMAQYAAFWAAREGSVTQASCPDMQDVALKSLLPTFIGLRSSEAVERESLHRGSRLGYRYDPSRERGFSGDIFWLMRERPLARDVHRRLEETFDQGGEPMRLEVRLVFWYPLRIPFADWVMTKMMRAWFGVAPYRGANPLMLAERDARWVESPEQFEERALRAEYARRTEAGEYVFPIVTTASMRMMTPPAPEHFRSQHCELSPP
jgi:hypothetical protein